MRRRNERGDPHEKSSEVDVCHFCREIKTEEHRFEIEPKVDTFVARRRTDDITCWIVSFFLSLWIFGFMPAMTNAAFVYLEFSAGEKRPITLAITAACWQLLSGAFEYKLQRPFFRGVFFDWVHFDVPALGSFFCRWRLTTLRNKLDRVGRME